MPGLIERHAPFVDQGVKGWTVRRGRTKRVSCTPNSGRIALNLELAREHPNRIEYIIAHEMTQRERTHEDGFAGLLDDYPPCWRALRDQLNLAPLTYEECWW